MATLMACRACSSLPAGGLERWSTGKQFPSIPTFGISIESSSSTSKHLRRRLRCSKAKLLPQIVGLSSRGSERSFRGTSHKGRGARDCFRLNHWPSSQPVLRPLDNGGFVGNASASGNISTDSEGKADSHANVSNDEHVGTFLQKVANLRILPALVLGLGLYMSLRPGQAWAVAATAELSAEGKGVLASAWAGLVAGCLHTLTGPDHLAALAPLCIGRSRVQSAAVGALWGCGHDAGQIIFGLIFLLLKDKLHIELIRTWASRVVGLTLMTIGGLGIYESQEPVAVLADGHGLQDLSGARIKNDSKNATTFATGIVYGLQPDALLMILPALALPSRLTGAAFLGMFLFGTVLAMGSYTLFLSSCSHALQKRLPGITKRLTLGSSLIAIALGLALIVTELFGVSLF